MKYHSLKKGWFYFQLQSNQMSGLTEKFLNLFLDSITCILSAPLQSQWLKWPFQSISIEFLIFKYTNIFILVTEKTEKIFRLLFFINLYKANMILKEKREEIRLPRFNIKGKTLPMEIEKWFESCPLSINSNSSPKSIVWIPGMVIKNFT